MKKALVVLMCVLMVVAMVACNNTDDVTEYTIQVKVVEVTETGFNGEIAEDKDTLTAGTAVAVTYGEGVSYEGELAPEDVVVVTYTTVGEGDPLPLTITKIEAAAAE